MGDKVGMLNSNVLMKPKEDIRQDFYQLMSDLCAGNIPRNDMKAAIMPNLYGSLAKPEEIFPDDDDLELFYEAKDMALPSATKYSAICDRIWDNKADNHSWSMPDGHYVSVRSYYKDCDEFKIVNDDIETTIKIQFRNYCACDYNTPLSPNITQSIDAYIVRLMIGKAKKLGFELLCIHD